LSMPAGAKLEGPTGLTPDFPGGLVGTFDGLVALDAGSGQMALSAGDDSTWDFTGVDIDLTVGAFNITGDLTVDGKSVRQKPHIVASGNIDVANLGTAGWETVVTIPIPAGLLTTDGDTLVLITDAKMAANGNTKGHRVQLGGVDIATNSNANNDTTQEWHVRIRRKGAATGAARGRIHYAATAVYTYNEISITPTWANALSLTVQVQGLTAIGDITALSYELQYHPKV